MLEGLASTQPETRGQLFPDGELNRYVNVYLNDEDVRVLDGLVTTVANGDAVVILPPMAGGVRWASNQAAAAPPLAARSCRRYTR